MQQPESREYLQRPGGTNNMRNLREEELEKSKHLLQGAHVVYATNR